MPRSRNVHGLEAEISRIRLSGRLIRRRGIRFITVHPGHHVISVIDVDGGGIEQRIQDNQIDLGRIHLAGGLGLRTAQRHQHGVPR